MSCIHSHLDTISLYVGLQIENYKTYQFLFFYHFECVHPTREKKAVVKWIASMAESRMLFEKKNWKSTNEIKWILYRIGEKKIYTTHTHCIYNLYHIIINNNNKVYHWGLQYALNEMKTIFYGTNECWILFFFNYHTVLILDLLPLQFFFLSFSLWEFRFFFIYSFGILSDGFEMWFVEYYVLRYIVNNKLCL